MVLYNYINNDFCKSQSINNNFNWFIIYHFCEHINNNQDWVIYFAFQLLEPGNQVRIYMDRFFHWCIGIKKDCMLLYKLCFINFEVEQTSQFLTYNSTLAQKVGQ